MEAGTPTHPCPRLFSAEVDRAGHLSEQLGLGIAAFQGLSNLALNGERGPRSGTSVAMGWDSLGQDLLQMPLLRVPFKSQLCPHPTGIVLGTIFVGGSLMAGDELSPGDLMSFLVASQTVQRSGQGRSQWYPQYPWHPLYPAACLGTALSSTSALVPPRSLANISILMGQVGGVGGPGTP